MSKMKVQFEIEGVTEAQLRELARQYKAAELRIETIKPPRNLAGVKTAMEKLAAAAGAEMKRLTDLASQGAANPGAVTDAHVAEFCKALETGAQYVATAAKDIQRLANPQ